jgi:hypothetical protein
MHRRRFSFTIGMTVLMLGYIGIGSVNAAESKSTQANWENLKQLAAGQQIRVVLDDAKSYRAQFQRVSDEGLVVHAGGGEQTFERQKILRVSTKGASHRGPNAAIGASIGGAGGALIGANPSTAFSQVSRGRSMLFGMLSGIGVGIAVGAAMPTGGWHDVYRVRCA